MFSFVATFKIGKNIHLNIKIPTFKEQRQSIQAWTNK